MSLATIGGFGVEWLELSLPFNGAWIIRAKLDIGDDSAPSIGAFSCKFDDGQSTIEYIGTIIRSQEDTGDAYIVGVGGAGKLGTLLPGVDYLQPQARTIARDILTACKETEGDMSGLDSLARIEPAYSCLSATAARQLDSLCEAIKARWYTRVNGAINIGPATWPTYAGDPFITHTPNQNGIAIGEPNIPNIEAASIVNGFLVSSVRYYLDEYGLTAYLEVTDER